MRIDFWVFVGFALSVASACGDDDDDGTEADRLLVGAQCDTEDECRRDEAQAWHDWMAAEGISWTAWKLDACADASCFFAPGAPFTGGWTAENLQGHGSFVVDRLAD